MFYVPVYTNLLINPVVGWTDGPMYYGESAYCGGVCGGMMSFAAHAALGLASALFTVGSVPDLRHAPQGKHLFSTCQLVCRSAPHRARHGHAGRSAALDSVTLPLLGPQGRPRPHLGRIKRMYDGHSWNPSSSATCISSFVSMNAACGARRGVLLDSKQHPSVAHLVPLGPHG